MANVILEVRNVTKTFPGVTALDEVDFTLHEGSVHAVVGENGAGKSTLMMILGGVYGQDSGEILVNGAPVRFSSANQAIQDGISVVYQELSLVPNLSVAENIYAHEQPTRALNLVNWDALYRQTTEILSRFELDDINPRTLVGDLTMGKRQVVEILKAMAANPKILVFDEPTSSLTDVEIRELFSNIRRLQKEGISIIYISHHLNEIFQIADTVTVLRDGRKVCDANVAEIDENFLVSNMVGRQIDNMYGQRGDTARIGQPYFEVKDLSRPPDFSDVSFHIREGEIVGFSGLVGAGRTELGRAIFGAEPAQSGSIVLRGAELRLKNTRAAIEAGIGYLSEDRKEHGLYLQFDIRNNLTSNHLRDFSNRRGFLKRRKIDEFSERQVKEFNIITPAITQMLNNLSGGNQQKVLVAEWFGIGPKLLIVDEPTRGVDVGAKSDIYVLLRKLASEGVGIMLISSDLPEIIGLSDRVYVMREGRLVGEVQKADLTEENIIGLATGIHENDEGRQN